MSDDRSSLPSRASSWQSKPPELHELGRQIRRLRRERELSQEALAARAGLGPNTVGDVERAVMGASVTTLVKIANGLGVPIRELFPEG